MVESPSQPTAFIGTHATTPYNKPTNECTWCYESSTPAYTNTDKSIDECLPQLEIDDKPLIYRQQFQAKVNINKQL